MDKATFEKLQQAFKKSALKGTPSSPARQQERAEAFQELRELDLEFDEYFDE